MIAHLNRRSHVTPPEHLLPPLDSKPPPEHNLRSKPAHKSEWVGKEKAKKHRNPEGSLQPMGDEQSPPNEKLARSVSDGVSKNSNVVGNKDNNTRRKSPKKHKSNNNNNLPDQAKDTDAEKDPVASTPASWFNAELFLRESVQLNASEKKNRITNENVNINVNTIASTNTNGGTTKAANANANTGAQNLTEFQRALRRLEAEGSYGKRNESNDENNSKEINTGKKASQDGPVMSTQDIQSILKKLNKPETNPVAPNPKQSSSSANSRGTSADIGSDIGDNADMDYNDGTVDHEDWRAALYSRDGKDAARKDTEERRRRDSAEEEASDVIGDEESEDIHKYLQAHQTKIGHSKSKSVSSVAHSEDEYSEDPFEEYDDDRDI